VWKERSAALQSDSCGARRVLSGRARAQGLAEVAPGLLYWGVFDCPPTRYSSLFQFNNNAPQFGQCQQQWKHSGSMGDQPNPTPVFFAMRPDLGRPDFQNGILTTTNCGVQRELNPVFLLHTGYAFWVFEALGAPAEPRESVVNQTHQPGNHTTTSLGLNQGCPQNAPNGKSPLLQGAVDQ